METKRASIPCKSRPHYWRNRILHWMVTNLHAVHIYVLQLRILLPPVSSPLHECNLGLSAIWMGTNSLIHSRAPKHQSVVCTFGSESIASSAMYETCPDSAGTGVPKMASLYHVPTALQCILHSQIPPGTRKKYNGHLILFDRLSSPFLLACPSWSKSSASVDSAARQPPLPALVASTVKRSPLAPPAC